MKIVLSRLDRVGDLIILSTPAIASFRRSFPDAHITLVCSESQQRAAVERNPDIDDLVIAEPADSIRALGERFRGEADLAIALAPRTMDFVLVRARRARGAGSGTPTFAVISRARSRR